jgi:hypothetical protein
MVYSTIVFSHLTTVKEHMKIKEAGCLPYLKLSAHYKPIGASPGRDYVLTRMVLQIILYSIWYGMIHQKRGGMLRGLRIKREREEYVIVGILFLRKPH